jgi:hypothetical protein
MGKPSIGRIVHYQSYGTPGGEHPSEPCAAIITAVKPETDDNLAQAHAEGWSEDSEARFLLTLTVFYPNGTSCKSDVRWDPNNSGGTWHWPERV